MTEQTITVNYGFKVLPPIVWELTTKQVKRKYWFGYRTEYYISTQYVTVGPFENEAEALKYLAIGNSFR